MENPVFSEIKNWHLFTEKFGEEYKMHDAVVKRFDLNEDELTVVINTLYDMQDDKVYDVTFKFSHLISIDSNCEMGNDYVWGIDVKKDNTFKNLFHFKIEDTQIEIACFTIELVSITESEPFQRGIYLLEDKDVTPETAKRLWRS